LGQREPAGRRPVIGNLDPIDADRGEPGHDADDAGAADAAIRGLQIRLGGGDRTGAANASISLAVAGRDPHMRRPSSEADPANALAGQGQLKRPPIAARPRTRAETCRQQHADDQQNAAETRAQILCHASPPGTPSRS
jgi:hypothetical protein